MIHVVPSVGRIVRYVSHGTPVRADGSQAFTPQCRAAIITEVGDLANNEGVGLCVLNPTGQFFNQHVMRDGNPERDSGPMGGTWHWPERA